MVKTKISHQLLDGLLQSFIIHRRKNLKHRFGKYLFDKIQVEIGEDIFLKIFM